MLGKRSRRPIQRTQSKFHLMSNGEQSSGPKNKSNGFFNSPRIFTGFNSKKNPALPDFEGGSRSPTSTLDAKAFSDFKPCRSPRGFADGVGLGILAALHNDNSIGKTTLLSPKGSETGSRTQTLGCSNNKRSQPISIGPAAPPPRDKPIGMEYSESYTCITSHGPKPSVRQIFNDPVAEVEKRSLKCCKPAVFETAAAFSFSDADGAAFPDADFLSVCYLCRRQLRHEKDIYMYRGDKAFCSVECRYQQIVTDERCASLSRKRGSAVVGKSPQATCFYPVANIFTTSTMAAA